MFIHDFLMLDAHMLLVGSSAESFSAQRRNKVKEFFIYREFANLYISLVAGGFVLPHCNFFINELLLLDYIN